MVITTLGFRDNGAEIQHNGLRHHSPRTIGPFRSETVDVLHHPIPILHRLNAPLSAFKKQICAARGGVRILAVDNASAPGSEVETSEELIGVLRLRSSGSRGVAQLLSVRSERGRREILEGLEA